MNLFDLVIVKNIFEARQDEFKKKSIALGVKIVRLTQKIDDELKLFRDSFSKKFEKEIKEMESIAEKNSSKAKDLEQKVNILFEDELKKLEMEGFELPVFEVNDLDGLGLGLADLGHLLSVGILKDDEE
jgi:hypothetical protein